jgi:Na+/H+ antiporter NhaC
MQQSKPSTLHFHGGLFGSLVPFAVFLTGVVWLGLSGAPDERGLWPVVLASLTMGLVLAKDRKHFSETVVEGTSQPIVMIMVLAWLLAGVLGTLMSETGLVEALIWLSQRAGVTGGGYVATAFLICCAVSTSTGTSIGTLLICSPLLYPAGGSLGANPAVLMGAILGGATFGDNISPISDTTIASALTQGADIGGVVRSRLKYAIPAAAAALVLYVGFGNAAPSLSSASSLIVESSPRGLPMLVAPVFVIGLLLVGRHLLEGLLFGILAATGLGLLLRLIEPTQLIYVDAASFSAKGIILDGLERGIGISIFTLLLMGLVATLQASGVLDRLLETARKTAHTERGAELWIFGSVSAAVLLTTHSVVAILTVGTFAKETGERFRLSAYRRANLLDATVCTFPFVLPYFIPVILAASTTAGGVELGMPRLSPFESGLYNFHSWMLFIIVVLAIFTGFGRRTEK